MKVSITKSILETMLVNAQPYLEKKDLSQITSHVLIQTQNEDFFIKAMDYEIGLFYKTKQSKISDQGFATANGKKLLDIVKILKDEDVILETINDNLYIKQKSSKYKLPMFNAKDFPTFPEIENKPKFNINSTDFSRAIKKIAPAIDTNNPKFELNGALIDIKDNSISLVATDTRRLSIFKLKNEIKDTFSLIIPKKAINEIQKLLFDDIEIFYDSTTLIVKSNNFQFFTKLINGKFPDYERIIPKEKRFRLLLNRESMIESIKQISIISNEIRITFKPSSIVFESLNHENIEAKTELQFNTGLDIDIKIAMNARYILDFLANIEKNEFVFGYNDESLPFTLESEDLLTIIMPIII